MYVFAFGSIVVTEPVEESIIVIIVCVTLVSGPFSENPGSEIFCSMRIRVPLIAYRVSAGGLPMNILETTSPSKDFPFIRLHEAPNVAVKRSVRNRIAWRE
jgi:hypothetical protein